MKNSKLIPILKTFSKQDWNEFKRWHRSTCERGSNAEKIVIVLSNIKHWSAILSNAEIIEILLKEKSLKGY